MALLIPASTGPAVSPDKVAFTNVKPTTITHVKTWADYSPSSKSVGEMTPMMSVDRVIKNGKNGGFGDLSSAMTASTGSEASPYQGSISSDWSVSSLPKRLSLSALPPNSSPNNMTLSALPPNSSPNNMKVKNTFIELVDEGDNEPHIPARARSNTEPNNVIFQSILDSRRGSVDSRRGSVDSRRSSLMSIPDGEAFGPLMTRYSTMGDGESFTASEPPSVYRLVPTEVSVVSAATSAQSGSSPKAPPGVWTKPAAPPGVWATSQVSSSPTATSTPSMQPSMTMAAQPMAVMTSQPVVSVMTSPMAACGTAAQPAMFVPVSPQVMQASMIPQAVQVQRPAKPPGNWGTPVSTVVSS